MPQGYGLIYRNLADGSIEVQIAGRAFFASSSPVTIVSGLDVIGSWFDPFAKPRALLNFTGTVNVSGTGWVALGATITASGADYTPPPVFGSSTAAADVNVLNFPLEQSITGSVSVSNFPDPQNVSVINGVSLDYSTVANQFSTFGGFTLQDNGPGAVSAVSLPGYNTVTPTVELGVMQLSGNINAVPMLLMLWNSSSNKWQAASCDASGKLQVAL